MNEAVRRVALQYLDNQQITESLLNHIEVAIRAFDPYLSCATHAIGRMPLEVELVDASVSCSTPYTFSRLRAQKDTSYTSHVLSPMALQYSYIQLMENLLLPTSYK